MDAETQAGILNAIRQWLEYGESSYNPHKTTDPHSPGHAGYFSPGGWAYQTLKAHADMLAREAPDGR